MLSSSFSQRNTYLRNPHKKRGLNNNHEIDHESNCEKPYEVSSNGKNSRISNKNVSSIVGNVKEYEPKPQAHKRKRENSTLTLQVFNVYQILKIRLIHFGLGLNWILKHGKKYTPKILHYTLILGFLVLLFALCLFLLVFHGFVRDAQQLCRLPASRPTITKANPLVEYYIHGHGYGHYTRSLAIIEQLNKAGIDVRMFISRSKMWEEVHYHFDSYNSPLLSERVQEALQRIWAEAHLLSVNQSVLPVHNDLLDEEQRNELHGETTAISVSSILPGFSVIATLSRITERIVGDCEVAIQTQRYPILVISDGDAPGILRAKLGSIPSVSISHGNFFALQKPPAWLSASAAGAWNSQASLNSQTMYFSDWQIGVHYSNHSYTSRDMVVPPRMRKNVLQMKELRNLREDYSRNNKLQLIQHRPFVLCYFRDNNGKKIIDFLLSQGVNVINMLPSSKNTGQQWMLSNANYTPLPDHSMTNTNLPFKDDSSKPQLIQITDPTLFSPLMSIADGVISSAGSNTITECVFAQIPFFAFHLEKDSEQLLNVELMRHYDQSLSNHFLFGASFEMFRRQLSKNGLRSAIDSKLAKDLMNFFHLVKSSRISYVYFQELKNNLSLKREPESLSLNDIHLSNQTLDAADVILEIINNLKK